MNNRNIKPISPFIIFCQKVIPLAFDESMSYYECLCALTSYLYNQVIPAVNNNADAVTELQNYVEHYFDNLDVQEEVNKKLDEMAESGQLQEIIAEYLELNGMLTFNTVNDMKNATNLIDGSVIQTIGFYNINDGGKCKYYVKTLTNDDIVDETTKFTLINYPSLIAVVIPDEKIYCKQYGFIKNENNDLKLNNLLTFIGNNEKIVVIDDNYNFASDIIIPKNVTLYFENGKINSENNVTINGIIKSDLNYIFNVSGTLTLNTSLNSVGYPEWFGAKTNDSTINNENAINKCIDIFPTTILQAGTYYTNDTIYVIKGNKTIKGINKNATIMIKNNLKEVMLVGSINKPNTVNDFNRNICIKNITITRNTLDWVNNSIGLHCQYTLDSLIENINSNEHANCFYINGTVFTKFNKCKAFCSTLSTGDTTRIATGFILNGLDNIGLAGNNASLYIEDCNTSFGGIIYTGSKGMDIRSNYGVADLYIDKFETAFSFIGIELAGGNTGNDIYITKCVIDAFKEHGIYIHDFNNIGNINLSDNYVAPSGDAVSPSNFGIRISNYSGNMSLSNNQIICESSTNCLPLFITNSSNINSISNMISEAGRGSTILNSSNIKVMDIYKNKFVQNSYEPAINCTTVNKCYIAPNINCIQDYIQGGVYLTGSKNEINVTQINNTFDSINNYVHINGNSVTSTGITSDNLISGIF